MFHPRSRRPPSRRCWRNLTYRLGWREVIPADTESLSLVEVTWATSRATAAWLPHRSSSTSRLSVSVSGTPLKFNRDGHVERDVRHPLSTRLRRSGTANSNLLAAFDTVYHHILLQRLTTTYSVNGTVLRWLACCLSNRTQGPFTHRTTSYVNLYATTDDVVRCCPLSSVVVRRRTANHMHRYVNDMQI